MQKTDTIQITSDLLALLSEIDEFKSAAPSARSSRMAAFPYHLGTNKNSTHP